MAAASILKGPKSPLCTGNEPIEIHRIFENTVNYIEKISQNNNNNNNNNGEVKTNRWLNIGVSEAQKKALVSEETEMLYVELNDSANRLARALLGALPNGAPSGNADGDILIAVCMKPSADLIVTLLAIWKMGAAYLPLDKEFPRKRIEHILRESEPAMIVADDLDLGDEFAVARCADLKNAGSQLSQRNLNENEILKKGNDKSLAAVLYTSGSTGIPKGVRISHAAILNRLKWQFETFPYSTTEKVCAFKTALTFVDSICELWGPLLNARTLLIVPKEITKNPEKLTGLLERHEVERLVLVPTLLQSILMYGSMKNSKNFLRRLRLWVCSGETLSTSLANKFFDTFSDGSHHLCNFYGSTEVMGDVTYHVMTSKENLETEKVVPIGTPVDNCTVYVLDKFLRPVKLNEIGELYVSGFNLASGYVRGRDPDKFLDNVAGEFESGHSKLYKTGDFARIDGNKVYYEGRRDFQIKVRGHRVDLSEIESALAKFDRIEKYAVLTYKPGEIDQALLAFVTVRDGNVTETEIEKHLKTILASYMMPQVKIIDRFPLLVNGKVDKQYLLQKYRDEYDSKTNLDSNKNSVMDYSDVPKEKMEKARALFETITAVLGSGLRNYVNAKSNFYSLGGNSLNSIYTVTKLFDLGFTISISDFISSPTLLDVVEKMEETQGKAQWKSSRGKFKSELLAEKHRKDVFDVIASSFYEKADLERLLVPPVNFEDYIELLENIWPHLLEKNLSFVAVDTQGNVQGAALNFDAFDEPEVPISPSNKLNIVLEFLEYLERPVREEKLPQGKNKVLHSFMMGSKTNLSIKETIEVFCYMEEEVINLAKERNFQGVFTSNTNALTQQLGIDVNNYEALLDYQVNQYVASNGTKPFGKAPDIQRTIVSWRKL